MWTLPNIQKVRDIYPSAPDMMVSDWDLNSQASELASQFMWRSKLSQARTWSTRLKRTPWVREFTTRTLKPSHSESFEDALISYLGDSPANLSAKPGAKPETKILGIFSPISLKGLSNPNPLLYSSKMLRESHQQNLKVTDGEMTPERLFSCMSLENWSGWVTEQRQSRVVRQKSVRLTSVTDGLSLGWPTARVSDADGGRIRTEMTEDGFRSTRLNSNQWFGAKLRDAVETFEENWATEENWPTASTRDYKGGYRHQGGRIRNGKISKDTLDLAVLSEESGLADPNNHNTIGSHQESSLPLLKSLKPPQEMLYQLQVLEAIRCQIDRSTARLNARWVETLMGLPVGWVMLNCASPWEVTPMSLDFSETGSSPSLHPMLSSEGCLNWATPNAMDHLTPKSDETLLKQATGIRKGRSRPANLREQVDENALAIYEKAAEGQVPKENWATPGVCDSTRGSPETDEAKKARGAHTGKSLIDQVFDKENTMVIKHPNSMRTSASQITTAHDCMLKWWFNSIAKLPQKFDRKKLLGTVGHEVLERYQLGQEIYPTGWTHPTNRFTKQKEAHGITTTEQAVVKTLVTSAINSNKVRREPDGEVEKEFGKELGTVAEIEGVKVTFLGFIDYFYGNNIDDHKFTGAAKYYGKTALARALPMNLYAWAGYQEGWLNHPTVWLRYNVFVKNVMKPEVKIVNVEKTRDEIDDFYAQHIEPMLKPMVLARKNCTSWEQVDSAMANGNAETICNKYAGCEYMDICLGKCSMENYKKRFEEVNLEEKKSNQSSILDRLKNGKTTTPTGKGKVIMSGFLAKMAKTEGKVAPTKTAQETQETVQEELVQEQATETTTVAGPAPWAFEACPVCKRNLADGKITVAGLSPDGSPCNICVMTTDAAKEADPSQAVLADFDVAVGTDGAVTWTAKAGEVVAEAEVVKEKPVVSEQVAQKGKAKFEEKILADDAPEEKAPLKPLAPKQEAPVKSAPSGQLDPTDKSGFNQDRTGSRGFTLTYAPARSKLKKSSKLGEANCVVHITELAELVGAKLLVVANEGGAAAEYWKSIPYFTRRDMLAHNALPIAEMVGNSIIDASGTIEASDEHVICSQIERYASIIIGSIK